MHKTNRQTLGIQNYCTSEKEDDSRVNSNDPGEILEKAYPHTCSLEHLRKGQLFRKKDLGEGAAEETGQGKAE